MSERTRAFDAAAKAQIDKRDTEHIEFASKTLECVFQVLWNMKVSATEFLFPKAVHEYKKKWWERSPDTFWANLDLDNRERLIKYAIQQYNPALLYEEGVGRKIG